MSGGKLFLPNQTIHQNKLKPITTDVMRLTKHLYRTAGSGAERSLTARSKVRGGGGTGDKQDYWGGVQAVT